MLTTGQVAHFETFGFLMLKGLFSDAEVSSIRRDYDSVWSEVPGGDPFTGERTPPQRDMTIASGPSIRFNVPPCG